MISLLGFLFCILELNISIEIYQEIKMEKQLIIESQDGNIDKVKQILESGGTDINHKNIEI